MSRPALTILDALDDPNLFAKHFAGDSWRPWRAFLATLFGLPLPDDQVDLFRASTGLQEPPQTTIREGWLICGRRAGKSRILALIGSYLAAFRDYRPHLAPGEVATVMIIAADQAQARTIFRYVESFFDETPLLLPLVIGRTQSSLTLARRVQIEVRSSSFRSVRGYSVAAALLDEVAFWRSEDSANPDVETIKALRPALLTIPGSMLLAASSPYAKSGALWATYRAHFGKPGRKLIWQSPSMTMNPKLDPDEIAAAYDEDPQAASAEYGAQFRADVSTFLDREAVEGLVERDVTVRPPQPGVEYRAFLDPSGGARDSFVLAIGHLEGEERVLDVLLERRPPFSPEAVVEEMAATMRDYRVHTALGDRYAGSWPVEAFRRHSIVYEQSAEPKSQLYIALLPLINSGRVRLLDNPRLVGQLAGLERRTARGGRDSVDHAPGAHDDLANAAAGALVGLGTGSAFYIGYLGDGLPEGALGPKSIVDMPAELWLNY